MSHPIIRLPGLSQNATDVRFIEGRGLPRSRSVSEDGVVEPFENRADGVFCDSPTIWLSAGEVSGDLYGAKLAQQLRINAPAITLMGMGGAQMKSAGVDILENVVDISTIGFLEPIYHFTRYLSTLNRVKKALATHRPDLVLAIDFQGFNMQVLKYAKSIGLKTAYFISPQEWQWGTDKGGKAVINATDHIFAIFEAEYAFYKRLGGAVTFVGHPLLDAVSPTFTKPDFLTHFQLNPQNTLISIFPGSRPQEIKYVYPHLLKAAELLAQSLPNLHFLISVATPELKAKIEKPLSKTTLSYTLIEGHSHDLIAHSTLTLTTSGTITLEHAIIGTPCVVAYKINPLSYQVATAIAGKKWKEKIGYIALPNIYAKKEIIPEFLQYNCTATHIATAAKTLLKSPQKYAKAKSDLQKIAQTLGQKGAIAKTAKECVEGF